MTLVPLLVVTIIHLLYKLMRVEVLGRENIHQCYDRNEPVIISYWHDQLLLMAMVYDGPGAVALVSASRDGEFLAKVIHLLGQETIRGSSSRGGSSALKEMIKRARTRTDLVITPDGPRGPRHEMKDGVAQLAKVTGRPVVPLSFVCSKGHRFGSWDRFLLPYPFSRGVFSFGEPLYFEPGESIGEYKQRVKAAMNDNVAHAEERLDHYGLSAV